MNRLTIWSALIDSIKNVFWNILVYKAIQNHVLIVENYNITILTVINH